MIHKNIFMDKLQIYAAQLGLSTITATIASKCGLLGWMLVAVAAAMVIDFLAGMAASAKEAVEHPDDKSYGWSSRKGMIGIFKKFGYILVIVASMIVDFLIYKLSGVLSVTLPMTMFFSTLVTAWFILNECLSITENGSEGAGIFDKGDCRAEGHSGTRREYIEGKYRNGGNRL